MGLLAVRAAVDADADQVVRVRTASWRAAYAGLIPPAYLDGLDTDAELLRARTRLRDRSPGRHHLVAERDGRVLGFAFAGPERPSVEAMRGERDGCGEVYALYVHPDAWFTGAGAALLDAACAALDDDGHGTLTLWVLERNAQARRFYERQGWRPDGARGGLLLGGVELTELRYARPVGALVAAAGGSVPISASADVSGTGLPRQAGRPGAGA